jgi:hypothetical protein
VLTRDFLKGYRRRLGNYHRDIVEGV